MSVALDDKDEALLSELERNARASVVDLARRIGLSRSATQERLARLERSGAIAGYTVRRGGMAGGRRAHAWLTVRYADSVSCAQIMPRLRHMDDVRAAYALSGDLDLLVEVETDGTAALERVAEAIRAVPGVARVTSHMVLAAHRD